MAICNRDLDVSQSNEVISARVPTTAVGSTTFSGLHQVAYPGAIKAFSMSSKGVSGAVVGALVVERFVAGAGFTVIVLTGASLALVNVGTSGAQNWTLPAASSTLVQVLRGDVVSLNLVGGNNILEGQACLVIQALQDIKSPLGLTA